MVNACLIPILSQTANLLKALNMRALVRKYVRTITDEKKAAMREKALASTIFLKKKKGYEESVAKPFVKKRDSKQSF